MTDEQINAAIAEACGWKLIKTKEGGKITYPTGFEIEFTPFEWAKNRFTSMLLNYCEDLNAMHEAEKMLDSDELFRGYYLALYDITKSTRCPVHATARQRAEAFLRTIGKWEDGK
jgi:hypothetical protein